VLKAVLPSLNEFARIPVCGLIAHYSAAESAGGPDQLPTLMRAILVKRLTVRGFVKIICSVHIPYLFRLDRFVSPIPISFTRRCFRVCQQFAARLLTGSGPASNPNCPNSAKRHRENELSLMEKSIWISLTLGRHLAAKGKARKRD
jgi:hypothetical protein